MCIWKQFIKYGPKKFRMIHITRALVASVVVSARPLLFTSDVAVLQAAEIDAALLSAVGSDDGDGHSR